MSNEHTVGMELKLLEKGEHTGTAYSNYQNTPIILINIIKSQNKMNPIETNPNGLRHVFHK